MRVALLALLLAPGSAVQAGNHTTGIRKVVSLLQEMLKTVETEASEDLESYDKYKCWCETSKAEKEKAVEDAEKKIGELEAFLEGAAGKEAELKTQIAQLEEDIQEDKDALASAEAQRAKEAEEFAAEEADLKDCLGALGEAIAVLSKVQFLQKSGAGSAVLAKRAGPLLLQLQRMVAKRSPALTQFRGMMQKDFFDVLGALNEVAGGPQGGLLSGRAMSALAEQSKLLPWEKTDEQIGMESKLNDLVGMAAGAKSYNARSGQILGILKQMGDEFATSLAEAQKAELEAMITFHKLQAAKIAEIAAATKEKDEKETELAELGQKVADAKKDLEETKETLAEDQKFLVDLEKNCKQVDEEYAGRVKIRTEEIRALHETIAILTEDDARDLFGKTLSFLQLAAGTRKSDASVVTALRQRVDRAVAHISRVAGKNKDWALAALAVRAKLDGFAKVREMMDKMVAELKAQMKAEIEKKEKCVTDLDTNEDQIKEATWEKEDLEEKKLAYENAIEVLETDIAALKEDIAEMEISLKKAGEDRKEENLLFQSSVSDSRATINILNKALARLQEFYNKKALAQTGVAPPPPKPKDYHKSGGAGGVMQLLSMVIEEAEAGEAALVVDEKHAQESYATLVSDAKASIEANRAAVAEKSTTLAETEGLLSETEEALLANGEKLAKLDELLHAIHMDCDWILKYFDVRQTARQEDIDAILEAKAILAGAGR